MALDDEALEAVLGDTSLANAPARLPGNGLSGHRPIVPVAEQRDRRETLSQLLSAGISKDRILQTMMSPTKPDGTPGFSMTERAVEELIGEVYQTWRDEDAAGRPHKKAAATRRIKRTIARATAKGAYTAAAQLERTLMMIEGTAEPLKVEVTGVEAVSSALVQVLNVQSPEQLDELVAEGRKHLKAHGTGETTLLPHGTEIPEAIDASGE